MLQPSLLLLYTVKMFLSFLADDYVAHKQHRVLRLDRSADRIRSELGRRRLPLHADAYLRMHAVSDVQLSSPSFP